jgi:hypothetical protein
VGFWSNLFGSGESERQILTIDDYAAMVEQFTFQGIGYSTSGVQQTIHNNVERAPNTFEGYVNSIYKTNGIVFACMQARRAVFMQAKFKYRNFSDIGVGRLFGSTSLRSIEKPYPGGVTANLLSRMIDDADLCGNWYGWKTEGEIIRLRPDWVDIVLEPRMVTDRGPAGQVGWRKIGYLYFQGGNRDREGVPFLLDEIAHWAPNPDPTAEWRGMTWLTPVLREILADKQLTSHKLSYLEQGATPNMVVKLPDVSEEKLKRFKSVMDANHAGARNAGKTLYLGSGADVTIVGSDLKELDFKAVQGAGETRIASAAGVPPVIVGFSEGLNGSSLNQGNYSAARRNFADRTLHPLWELASASLEWLVGAPSGAELVVDTRGIPFLREDEKDRAEIQAREVASIRQLIDGGFEPQSVTDSIQANDWSLLRHTGLLSVQLQPPNTSGDSTPIRVQAMTVTDVRLAAELMTKGWTPAEASPKLQEITA